MFALTLGRLRSFTVPVGAAEDEVVATTAAVAAALFAAALLEPPFAPCTLAAVRLLFETPDELVGPRRAFSFWFVTMLEASDRESSMFRGRGGMM